MRDAGPWGGAAIMTVMTVVGLMVDISLSVLKLIIAKDAEGFGFWRLCHDVHHQKSLESVFALGLHCVMEFGPMALPALRLAGVRMASKVKVRLRQHRRP